MRAFIIIAGWLACGLISQATASCAHHSAALAHSQQYTYPSYPTNSSSTAYPTEFASSSTPPSSIYLNNTFSISPTISSTTITSSSSYTTTIASSTATIAVIANRTNSGVNYVEGPYTPFVPGYLGGTWELFYNTNWVTLNGTGYLRLRWEIEYWKRAGFADPLSVNYTGTWLLVAGGGGYQFGQNDPAPFCNDPAGGCFNGTGGPTYGYTYFSDGSNPWHDSYYWLDGEVTLQTQERTGLYNVGVQTSTIEDILKDINTNIDDAYHYGVTFDPASESCPCEVETKAST